MQRKRQWAGRQEGNQSRSTKAKHEENREDGAGVQKDGGLVERQNKGVCREDEKEQQLRGETESLPHGNRTGARGSRLQGQLTADCRWQR